MQSVFFSLLHGNHCHVINIRQMPAVAARAETPIPKYQQEGRTLPLSRYNTKGAFKAWIHGRYIYLGQPKP